MEDVNREVNFFFWGGGVGLGGRVGGVRMDVN